MRYISKVTRRAGSLHYTPKKKHRSRGGCARAHPPGLSRVRPLRPPQPAAGYAVRPCPVPGVFFGGPLRSPGAVAGSGRVSPLGFLPCLLFVSRLGGRGGSGRVCGSGVVFGVVLVPLSRCGGGGGRGLRWSLSGGGWSSSAWSRSGFSRSPRSSPGGCPRSGGFRVLRVLSEPGLVLLRGRRVSVPLSRCCRIPPFTFSSLLCLTNQSAFPDQNRSPTNFTHFSILTPHFKGSHSGKSYSGG